MRLPRPALGLVVALVAACGSGDDLPATAGDDAAPTSTTTTTADSDAGRSTSTTVAPTTTAAPSTTSTTTAPTTTESPFDRAAGSGTVHLDGERHEVEVLACGWLSSRGSGEPLEGEPNVRDDFRITVMEQVDDVVFIANLDRDGRVGVVFLDVFEVVIGSAGFDDPRNLWWGNDRQNASLVAVEGGEVTTNDPLTVLEDPSSFSSPAHDLDIDVTCTEFGGVPDEFAQVVAEAAGVELHQFGATGLVTIDGTEYAVETVTCSPAGGVEGVAESPAHDLVVSVGDLGPEAAGILSDTVGIDIGDRFLIADDGVDIVIDGTTLRTAEPVQLHDLYTREPAGFATVAIDCG